MKIEDIEKLLREINDEHIALSTNIEHIKIGFLDIKTELKSISNILETQIVHSEKIKELEKKIEAYNTRFNKVSFILFTAVISIVAKIVITHFN